MNIKRNIFLIYCYTFCVGTVFILPVIVPYFEKKIGLTFQQFLIGEAVFATMVILMEVPSGWISDVWSRKGTLLVGMITCIIGYIGFLFADNFITAVISQGVIGAGIAFHSGTVTSLIYDTLATNNKQHLYQKLEGKRHGISLYSIAMASVVGGILFQYNMKLPLIMDIVTLSIAAICTLFIIEPARIKRQAVKRPIQDMIITMKYSLHGHKEIAGIILVSTVLFCTTKTFMWVQQPYMSHVGISTDYFGYIMALGFLFGGLIGHFGHYIKHQLSNRHMIMILTFIPILAAIVAINFQIPLSILAILIVTGVWGYGFPFVQNAINKHADAARRATILSTLGLMISLAFIPTNLILGWLDSHYSIAYGLGYLAVQLLLFSAIGFWLWSRNVKKM